MKKVTPPAVEPPTLAPALAVVRLKELKARLEEAGGKVKLAHEDVEKLDFALQSTLRDACGANHPDIGRVSSAGGFGNIFVSEPEAVLAPRRAKKQLARAGVLGELIEALERKIADSQPATSAPAVAQPSPLQRVGRLVKRFHRAALQLRKRHSGRPPLNIDDEYDVQDLLHALLKLEFNDIRAEEWTPSYAGKSSRMDFLLKDEQLVVEVKMTRDGLGEKQVGDELLVDIGRYRVHADCKTLVCFVYDPEHRIGNPDGLEKDLSGVRDGLTVRVFIAPRS